MRGAGPSDRTELRRFPPLRAKRGAPCVMSHLIYATENNTEFRRGR